MGTNKTAGRAGVDARLFYRDARQLSQAAAFFEGERPAGLVGYSPWRWPVVIGRHGALAYLVASQHHRPSADVFANFCRVYAETLFARAPEAFRLIDAFSLPFALPSVGGYVHAGIEERGRRYLAVVDVHLQRIDGALLVEYSPEGRFYTRLRGARERRAGQGAPVAVAVKAIALARRRGPIPAPPAAAKALAERAGIAPRAAAQLLSGELLDVSGARGAAALDFDVAAEALAAAAGDDPRELWEPLGRGRGDDDSPVARIARRLRELAAEGPLEPLVSLSGSRRGSTVSLRRAGPVARLSTREVTPDPTLMSRAAVTALKEILARRHPEKLILYGAPDERRLSRRGVHPDDFDGRIGLAEGLPAKKLAELIRPDPASLSIALHQVRYDAGIDAFRGALRALSKRLSRPAFERAADYIFLHQEAAH
jgi:hypothetical protein